jgi:hypothetical protein
MDQNEIPHDPSHLGLPSGSGASIMTSDPMVCWAQTMHLSGIKTVSISKQNEIWFYMTHVTKQFHRVRPKQFPRQWYVRRKPHTYLASRLALSPNEPKRVSTWASSPRSTIGCIQNDFYAYGTLVQTVHLSFTDTNAISKRTEMRFHKTHVT